MVLWRMFVDGMLAFSALVWGDFMLYFLGLGALFITFRVGFLQFTHFGYVWNQTLGKLYARKKNAADGAVGTITPFQALSTALANTIGSGNIVGVGLAIYWGGPGAVFWMWAVACLGMATKMAEIVLGLKYRVKTPEGLYVGGPQYYLSLGLKRFKMQWLGPLYGVMLVLCLGIIEMIQINSVTASVNEAFGIPVHVVGITIGIFVSIVVFGGIKRIGQFAELAVPFMAVLYIATALVIVLLNLSHIPGAFVMIFKHAFTPVAAVGGFAGSVVANTIRWGVARGVFSNEAGDGATAIAHATATTDHPVRQGLYGIMEVFVDTIVVCTATALVVLVTGVWTDPAVKEVPERLLTIAFGSALGSVGGWIVAVSLTLFAMTSMLAYVYFGEAQGTYFGGKNCGLFVRVMFLLAIFTGTFWPAKELWPFSDVFFAMMIIPNMIGLFLLNAEYSALVKEFFNTPGLYYMKDMEDKKSKG